MVKVQDTDVIDIYEQICTPGSTQDWFVFLLFYPA